jgi:hypothetical protein
MRPGTDLPTAENRRRIQIQLRIENQCPAHKSRAASDLCTPAARTESNSIKPEGSEQRRGTKIRNGEIHEEQLRQKATESFPTRTLYERIEIDLETGPPSVL